MLVTAVKFRWAPLHWRPWCDLMKCTFGSGTAFGAMSRRFDEALCAAASQDGSLSLRRASDVSDQQVELDYESWCHSGPPRGLRPGGRPREWSVAVLRRGSWSYYKGHTSDVTELVISVVAGRMALVSATTAASGSGTWRR